MRFDPLHVTIVAASALWVGGCKAPPAAPAALDDLAAYIYSHHADEDPEAMQLALEQLTTWLDQNWAEAEEGYEISALDEGTVDAVDDVDRATEGMMGLAVPTASVHTVPMSAYAMVGVPCDVVYPDLFEDYEREFVGDPDCFLDLECDRLEARENYESHFPLVVSISETYNQYWWVELEDGLAMVQRNWIVSPPEVTGAAASLVEVDEQFYLNLFLPRAGGFWRLQTTWMIFSQDSVPEDAAMQMAVSSMVGNSDTLDDYLGGLDWSDTGQPTTLPDDKGCSSTGSNPLPWAFFLVIPGLALRRQGRKRS